MPLSTGHSPILQVQRLYSDGRHNAFTSLIKYKGKFFVTWRNSSGHGRADGDIMIMSSPDGESWSLATRTPLSDLRDFMEGHLVEYKGRLFMYASSYERNNRSVNDISVWCCWSDDGVNWSEAQECFDSHAFWSPLVVNDVLYMTAYFRNRQAEMNFDGTFSGQGWYVKLLSSTDGINWNEVSVISANIGGNETALAAEPDGSIKAYIRLEAPPYHLMETHAKAPYTEWSTPVDCGWIAHGQIISDIDGRRFIMGRYRDCGCRGGGVFADRGNLRTTVRVCEHGYWVDYATLPSGGDCSYPGAVSLTPGTMLVSYYSQHEYLKTVAPEDFKDFDGPADIFLAWIKTDVPAKWGQLTRLGRDMLSRMERGEEFDLRKGIITGQPAENIKLR